MKKSILIVLSVIAVSLVAAALAMLVPAPAKLPPTTPDTAHFHSFMVTMVLYATQFVAVVVLFLASLKGFTKGFKRSYYYICAGLTMEAIYILVLIMLYANYDPTSMLIKNLTETNGTVVGSVLIYVGLHRFGRLLDIKSFVVSPWFVVTMAVMVSTVAWLLPHVQSRGTNELAFDLLDTGVIIQVTFSIAGVWLVWLIRSTANASYSRALGWFGAVAAVNALNFCIILSGNFLSSVNAIPIQILSLPFFLNAFLLVAAGVSFYRMAHSSGVPDVQGGHITLNVVMFLASLASRPADIDQILDTVRLITSQRRTMDEPFAPEDEEALGKVYISLENYLTTKEPLHAYTREQLRTIVRERFDWLPSSLSSNNSRIA